MSDSRLLVLGVVLGASLLGRGGSPLRRAPMGRRRLVRIPIWFQRSWDDDMEIIQGNYQNDLAGLAPDAAAEMLNKLAVRQLAAELVEAGLSTPTGDPSVYVSLVSTEAEEGTYPSAYIVRGIVEHHEGMSLKEVEEVVQDIGYDKGFMAGYFHWEDPRPSQATP